MTDKTQPEALRLAEQYDYGDPVAHSNTWKAAVCTELRRQHARIAELKARVQELGAMARENRSRRIVELEAQLEALRAALAASPTTPAEQQAAPKAAPGERRNTKTHDLLSTAVGLLMGYREDAARQPHKPGSVIDKIVNEAVEHLKDWPYPEAAPQQEAQDPFQNRVQPWLLQCFGAEIAADTVERNHRFLEEALELVQSTGCTQSEARQLVDYVFGRPVGEPAQEVGGVMVTLAALCLANGLDMHNAGEIELARIWTKVEAIRAKQAAKPKHSPLPQAAPQQEAQEPVAYAVYFPDQPTVELVHELDDLIDDLTNRPHVVTKLYTAPRPAPVEPLTISPLEEQQMFDDWCPYKGNPDPRTVWAAAIEAVNGLLLGAAAPQPAPAPLSDDTERLEWLLWKLPGDALRYVVGELADTSSGAEFRAAIDTAIAAQGGKA